jgi:GTP-binding protein
MTLLHYQNAEFLLSAAKISQLPSDVGAEVAFVGRSNAGKSSTLNALCQQKNLAKTSKTPGRTQLINVFELDAAHRLIDLPGYGFAKVSVDIKARWQKTLNTYLENRQCLQGLVLVMDARHPLKEVDKMLIQWTEATELPLHILLNKADKLKKGVAKQTLLQVQKALAEFPHCSLQLFSAEKRDGLEQLKSVLAIWFNIIDLNG